MTFRKLLDAMQVRRGRFATRERGAPKTIDLDTGGVQAQRWPRYL
jgi:hypothetical protein